MTAPVITIDNWRTWRADALAMSWSLRPWPLRYRRGAPRPGWRARRACAGLPADLFFASNTARAIAVCELCPVRADCLHDTFDVESAIPVHHIYGVVGGLCAADRQRIQRAASKAA